MDVYTAFLFGVLVGQWVLLFAIWRAITKLVRLLNSLESAERSNSQRSQHSYTVELLDAGRVQDIDRSEW